MKKGALVRMIAFGVCAVVASLASAATAPAGPGENVMSGGAAKSVVHYVNPAALDVAKIIAPPPKEGSIAALADLEAVLAVQTWCTSEQIAWAKRIERDEIFNHASILGSWFKKENLPLTTAFFTDLGEDLRALDAVAKKPFLRPRPSAIDRRVEPCVSVPASTSYPSGSALQAFVWAEILADLFPEKKEDVMARAHRVAWGRVIGGVHFPSDLVAGRVLAEAFLKECDKSRAFRDALEMSRREIAVFATK
ncbi:MAG: phosphatase PAP2 family protein [Opitutaceae bacterium]